MSRPLLCLILLLATALTQHFDIVIKPVALCLVPSDLSTLRTRSLVLKMSNKSRGTVANN